MMERGNRGALNRVLQTMPVVREDPRAIAFRETPAGQRRLVRLQLEDGGHATIVDRAERDRAAFMYGGVGPV